MLAPGSYFLSGDLTLTTDLTVNGAVTLDLKGHTLTGTGKGSVITVDSGGILTLNDTGGTGKITGGKNTHTEKPWLYGGGVSVSDGKFIMNGGTISNNVTGEYGGGVYINGATFKMSGGSITDNTANEDAGGVMINTGTQEGYIDGTFDMSGGSITGNSAKAKAGGVLLYRNDQGKYSTVFKVSGMVTVTGNHAGTDNVESNVSLYPDKTITAAGLTNGARIGVNLYSPPAGEKTVTICTGTAEASYFSSDDTSYEVVAGTDNNSVILKKTSATSSELPDGVPTRAEFAEIIQKHASFGLANETATPSFTDLEGCSNAQKNAIGVLAGKGILTGTQENTFAPLDGVNRGMAAVVIFRAAGSHDLGIVGDLPFTDITGEEWYDTAVASLWAMQVLVASDAVDGAFAPGQYITKTELQTWLSRYDAYKAGQGGTTDPGSGNDPGSGSDPYPDDIVPETRPDPVPPVSSSSVTKNPDGSTTTTTKNTTTGTVTVTTKNPDGSTSVVETKKDGTVTETVKDAGGNEVKTETKPDGTVTTTEKDAAGNKTSTVANPDGSGETKVDNSDGSTSTTKVDTGGQVKAEVKLSDKAVEAAEGAPVTLPMPELPVTSDRESAPAVTVELPKDAADVTVEIPVKEVTPGTVVVLVNADGTEEVVKTTLTTKNGVAVTVRDGVTVKVVDNSKQFDDVPETHWSSDAVSFASSRELLNGTSAGEATFSPDEDMTRAMLMTVLARFDGADTEGGSVWYEKSMEWAVANGVSDGTAPNSSITREQMVVILYRYAGSPPASGSLDSFADADNVSGYAADAMRWAVDNGLIGGTGDGALSPQGNATRAQVAAVLMRYVQKLAK